MRNYEYREINYREICKFYWSIYFKIQDCVCKDTYGEYYEKYGQLSKEEKNKYDNEIMKISGWLQKGTWSLGDLDDMYDYSDEDSFFYFAMNCLSNMRHRLESYLDDSDWQFPAEICEYTKYDDLVIDYYEPIRLCKGKFKKFREDEDYWWDYYYNLHFRKSKYEWVKKDIKEVQNQFNKLEKFLTTSIDNKEFDYSVSKIHDCLQSLKLEMFRLKLKIEEGKKDKLKSFLIK